MPKKKKANKREPLTLRQLHKALGLCLKKVKRGSDVEVVVALGNDEYAIGSVGQFGIIPDVVITLGDCE